MRRPVTLFAAANGGGAGTRATPAIPLRVVPSAAALLASFPGPLYVIAIAGKARKGKSTLARLLVLLLMRLAPPGTYTATEIAAVAASAMFAVGHQLNTVVTAGIDFWGEPIPRADGNGYWVVIDTEGTERGDDQLTAHLTAASVFLASTTVYHTDSFANSDVDKLFCVAELLSLPPTFAADHAAAVADMFSDLLVHWRSWSTSRLRADGLLVDRAPPRSNGAGNNGAAAVEQVFDGRDAATQAKLGAVFEEVLDRQAATGGAAAGKVGRFRTLFTRRGLAVSLACDDRVVDPALIAGDGLALLTAGGAPGGAAPAAAGAAAAAEAAAANNGSYNKFARSVVDVLHRIVTTCRPAAVDAATLVDVLTCCVLPALEYNVIDIPSVLFAVHQKRAEPHVAHAAFVAAQAIAQAVGAGLDDDATHQHVAAALLRLDAAADAVRDRAARALAGSFAAAAAAGRPFINAVQQFAAARLAVLVGERLVDARLRLLVAERRCVEASTALLQTQAAEASRDAATLDVGIAAARAEHADLERRRVARVAEEAAFAERMRQLAIERQAVENSRKSNRWCVVQ